LLVQHVSSTSKAEALPRQVPAADRQAYQQIVEVALEAQTDLMFMGIRGR